MLLKVLLCICLVQLLMENQQTANAKVFTRCGLANELMENGFSRTFIGQWICLVESESGKDTSKLINKANGSKGLGLFQIRSKNYCQFGRRGGKCNIKCEDLLNDDISDDSVCARLVEQELGFRAWDGWLRNCYKKNLPLPTC